MAKFISRMFTPSKSDGGAPIPQTPAAPKVEDAQAKADEEIRKKRMNKSKTILTGSQGLLYGADTDKKVLLGE